ncbi:hypothetical protein QJ850_gp677 [Acanthamoeba polyphaga mimivirus]|uniref:Transmembrane protein n=1 Tax=Acanthamoeba polyphaga mimivirus Kroon TaxID=3069720 RepID=A0A0G2Y8B4_9VIRU|nr:hypothetical protein QJ850_gp677 [Acanthamoeba polyphaga mimivirus]AKI80022.1 hypothetical protein [Acanthamoeba polyphaga mimivirus Kroon]
MCWNYQVSLIFSVIYIVTNSYYVIKRPLYWKQYLLFGSFYLTMEVFQTLQWLFGNVYSDSMYGQSVCNSINVNYTIVAFILIWLQPILFSVIGYQTTTTNKWFFSVLTVLNCFVFFYGLKLLYGGFEKPDYYTISNSMFGSSTCTNEGETGHLVWRFKPKTLDVFPNHLTYVILCIISFVMYENNATRVIGLGWLLSLIITKLLLAPTLVEIASSWCLLSIIANLLIVSYVHISTGIYLTSQ